MPQKANAAQMAARSVRAAKPRRKMPLTSSNSLGNSIPQFEMSSQQGGGLFGGSVQATGTFDFSAPSGGVSFPLPSLSGTNTSFGMNSFSRGTTPDFSGNESDPRADTTGEEAMRRNKSFRSNLQSLDSEAQRRNVPSQMSTSLAQSQPANPSNIFGSTNSQEKPSGAIFSFGQNTSQTPLGASTIDFNSGSTRDKPTSNIFSFGGTTSQPAVSSPSISFSSGPAQDKPGNNTLNFGQQTTQPQAPSSGFTFGPTAAQGKSTNNPFSFSQSSTQSSSSGVGFNSPQATDKPASNIFGQSQPQQPPTPSNMFGTSNQQSQFISSTNIFANLKSQPSTASNPFSTQAQSPSPTSSNILGGPNQPPLKATSNIFGHTNQVSAATPKIFGEQKPQSVPESNIFGSLNQEPTPFRNLFGSSAQQPSKPTTNIFGSLNKESMPTSSLFGNLNKSDGQLEAQSKLSNRGLTNGTDISATPGISSKTTTPIFSQAPSSNIFGGSQQSVCQLPFTKTLFPEGAVRATLTSLQQPSDPTTTTTQAEPFNAPKNTASLFESTESSGSSNSNTLSSPKPVDAPTSTSQPPPSNMFPSLPQPAKSQPTPSSVFNKPTAESHPASSASNFSSPSKALTNGDTVKQIANYLYRDLTAASEIPDDFMAPLVPARFTDSQRKEFYAAYRMRSLNKAMQKFFGDVPLGAEIENVMRFYSEMQEDILTRSCIPFQSSKRKVVENEGQENENPSKRAKKFDSPKLSQPQPATFPSAGSSDNRPQTANEPQKRATSPLKPQKSSLNGTTTPKVPVPAASQFFTPKAAAPVSPSPKGKRKDNPAGNIEDSQRMKMTKSNRSVGGSETSNIFKNIVDSPAEAPASPEKMSSLTKPSMDNTSHFNPFGNLPMPSASPSAPSGAVQSTSSAKPVPINNLFAAKPMPSTTNISSPKPAAMISAPNTFALETGEPANNAIKPPTFGSNQVNFLAQFGQQASKYTEDNEERLMKDAKAEDMDSDDDEAEWEARYREQRRTELKAIDDLAKSKRTTFVAGKGFTFDRAEKAPKTAQPSVSSSVQSNKAAQPAPTSSSRSHFGQSTVAPSSGTSIFSSLNASRASSPGQLASATGSVLDDHTLGRPVSFGGNIFAHLSDVDSGADSGKDNDADDESADDESGASNAEDDSEKKDPSYEPGADAGSGPGTPVEETGVGIASAKKAATPFTFGSGTKFGGTFGASTNSGTSSPGGSLFDRISKDINGNPIRQVSTEEKENAQPITTSVIGNNTNLFSSSFDKTPGGPTDKTWKADGPIKFGSATPTTSAPTVNVTAATPTKASSPFAGLFGNSGSSKQISTLTAGSGSVGVGFGFGGPSSTTSSLFPSAVTSTATSRATSPGGTDGDSAAEANTDPDAEHHEQIDLTSGGPGEENEEMLHEVRAKALKFSAPKEDDGSNPWETKGVGPLRVLKHKETNATRILLRADPSGTIVFNKGILAQINYQATGKTLKLLTAGEGGKGLETWLLQVKTPEMAEALASVLESNKPS
jgi:hypothetical protein